MNKFAFYSLHVMCVRGTVVVVKVARGGGKKKNPGPCCYFFFFHSFTFLFWENVVTTIQWVDFRYALVKILYTSNTRIYNQPNIMRSTLKNSYTVCQRNEHTIEFFSLFVVFVHSFSFYLVHVAWFVVVNVPNTSLSLVGYTLIPYLL